MRLGDTWWASVLVLIVIIAALTVTTAVYAAPMVITCEGGWNYNPQGVYDSYSGTWSWVYAVYCPSGNTTQVEQWTAPWWTLSFSDVSDLLAATAVLWALAWGLRLLVRGVLFNH